MEWLDQEIGGVQLAMTHPQVMEPLFRWMDHPWRAGQVAQNLGINIDGKFRLVAK